MVMRSFRMDHALAERLSEAAKARGTSESAFIREAVEKAIEGEKPPLTLYDTLKDIIDMSEGGGGEDTASRVDEIVMEELEKERQRWNRPRDPD